MEHACRIDWPGAPGLPETWEARKLTDTLGSMKSGAQKVAETTSRGLGQADGKVVAGG